MWLHGSLLVRLLNNHGVDCTEHDFNSTLNFLQKKYIIFSIEDASSYLPLKNKVGIYHIKQQRAITAAQTGSKFYVEMSGSLITI